MGPRVGFVLRHRSLMTAVGLKAGRCCFSRLARLGAFVADIAVKTGKGRSTVARDVTRAKKVAVLDDIAGTSLDKGDEIDALGKLPEGEQRKLATAARAGEKVSAKARKPRQKGADTAVRTTTAVRAKGRDVGHSPPPNVSGPPNFSAHQSWLSASRKDIG